MTRPQTVRTDSRVLPWLSRQFDLLSDSKNRGGPLFNNAAKREENLDAMGGLLRSSV